MNISNIFVNYVADAQRASPINLFAARVVLSVYILWRGASMEIRALTEWPVWYASYHSFMYPPEGFEWILISEKYLLMLFALFLLIGYRTRLGSFVVGVLFSHLTAVLMLMNTGGETEQMAIGALLVFLYGLYCEQDELSIDGMRRTGQVPLQTLNDRLQGPNTEEYTMTSLMLILLTLGILYAASPVGRFFNPGWITWTSPGNFARYLLIDGNEFGIPFFDVLVSTPLLLIALACFAMILEASLLVTAVARLPITPVIVGLFGMHSVIALTMGLFFFDMFFFLILFFSFDNLHTALSSDREIDVLYDADCYFCARSLYPIKLLDTKQHLHWYTQYNAPREYLDQDSVTLDEAMYVFVDGTPYKGFYAFQQLFKQFPETVVLSMGMRYSPVARVGERVYGYIAANRNRYFTCDYSSEEN